MANEVKKPEQKAVSPEMLQMAAMIGEAISAAIKANMPQAAHPALDDALNPVLLTGPVQAVLKAHEQGEKSEAEQAALKKELDKTLEQRNADMIRQRYGDGPKLFEVCLPKDPSQPKLKIPANSVEEATGRYLAFCGIRGHDHPLQAVPV